MDESNSFHKMYRINFGPFQKLKIHKFKAMTKNTSINSDCMNNDNTS